MTDSCADIRGRARVGQELPYVAVRPQGEHEHAMQAPDNVAVGVYAHGHGDRGTTRSDDELADAPLRVGPAVGILRREPFVEVVVRGNDHLGIEVVQRTPEGARGRVVAVL